MDRTGGLPAFFDQLLGGLDEPALEYSWDKWAVFPHPSQRELATGHFNSPVRVLGSTDCG